MNVGILGLKNLVTGALIKSVTFEQRLNISAKEIQTSGRRKAQKIRNVCKGPEVAAALHVHSRDSGEVHVVGTEKERNKK